MRPNDDAEFSQPPNPDPTDEASDQGTREASDRTTASSRPRDLVDAALADARAISRPRRRDDPSGNRARTRRDNLAGRRDNLAGRNGTAAAGRQRGYSAAGPDDVRDPTRLGEMLAGWVDEQGWDRPLAEARVFADWPSLVGADVAAHCTPQSLERGELRLAAESTAWAAQLRLLAGTLLARLVAELGDEIVSKIVISGPVAPTWKHGPRTVRGRGPRDTYG